MLKRLCWLLLALTLALPSSLTAFKGKENIPSVKRGDQPPGEAATMTSGVARAVVRDMLQKRYPVTIKSTMLLPGFTCFETKSVHISREVISFDYDYQDKKERRPTTHSMAMEKADYVGVGQAPAEHGSFYFIAPLKYMNAWRIYWSQAALAWKDQRDAQRFADAYNRLIYEYHLGGKSSGDEFNSFSAAAREWRQNSQGRPSPPPEWERQRILAENSIREKDFIKALNHYEQALQAHAMWPEGWFNTALLYEALGEYEFAADRMKHYLELAPDAADAAAAREKIIIWDDKAKR